jgi:hypothetical protein
MCRMFVEALVPLIKALVPLIFWCVVPMYMTHNMGRRVGKRHAVLWGLFLGWIGVLIMWLRTRKDWKQIQDEEIRRWREDQATRKMASDEYEDARKVYNRIFTGKSSEADTFVRLSGEDKEEAAKALQFLWRQSLQHNKHGFIQPPRRLVENVEAVTGEITWQARSSLKER